MIAHILCNLHNAEKRYFCVIVYDFDEYDESRENLHGKNIINFINLGGR